MDIISRVGGLFRARVRGRGVVFGSCRCSCIAGLCLGARIFLRCGILLCRFICGVALPLLPLSAYSPNAYLNILY
jgi:hypothetical protein